MSYKSLEAEWQICNVKNETLNQGWINTNKTHVIENFISLKSKKLRQSLSIKENKIIMENYFLQLSL